MTPKATTMKKKPRAKQPARGKAAKAKGAKSAKAKQGKRRASDAQAPKPRATWHRLSWQGVRLAICYKPKVFGYHAHLEVRVLAPQGKPIPLTESGYRSHFLPPGYVEEAGGAIAYVRRWLEQEAMSPAYRRALARWRQLDLFPPEALG